MLELGSVPRLLDLWPDAAFFFLDVMFQGFLQLVDLVNPLVGSRIESINLLDQSFRLDDFPAVMLLPFLQGLVFRPDLLRHRAIERHFFNLFMHFQLWLELRPELCSLVAARRLDVPERTLGLLMLVLQELNRIHCALLPVSIHSRDPVGQAATASLSSTALRQPVHSSVRQVLCRPSDKPGRSTM